MDFCEDFENSMARRELVMIVEIIGRRLKMFVMGYGNFEVQ
jgi:hypothetical protein